MNKEKTVNNVRKYYWKGIIDGENQEGEILAQSKEDATSQLRDKKVIITQLKIDGQKQNEATKLKKTEKTETNKARLFIERAKGNLFILSIIVFIVYGLFFLPDPKDTLPISSIFISSIFISSIIWIIFWIITQPYMIFSNESKSVSDKFSSTVYWLIALVALAVSLFPIIFGINTFQGFTTKAKITASTETHTRARDFIEHYQNKCFTINTALANSGFSCEDNKNDFVKKVVHYFQTIGWKNTYNPSETCCYIHSSHPVLGRTHIYPLNDSITIKTNIGTIDGGNKLLINKVMIKKHE